MSKRPFVVREGFPFGQHTISMWICSTKKRCRAKRDQLADRGEMMLRKIFGIIIQKAKGKEAVRVSYKKRPNISSLFHSTTDAGRGYSIFMQFAHQFNLQFSPSTLKIWSKYNNMWPKFDHLICIFLSL